MRSRWTRVPIRRPFECMLIASLIRYDAISMDKSANQAALPRRLMATLQVRSASDDASAPLMTPLMTPLMATLQVRCASDDASAPLIMPPLPRLSGASASISNATPHRSTATSTLGAECTARLGSTPTVTLGRSGRFSPSGRAPDPSKRILPSTRPRCVRAFCTLRRCSDRCADGL